MKQTIEIQFEPGFKECVFFIEKVWLHNNQFHVLSSLTLPLLLQLDAEELIYKTLSLPVEAELEVVHYILIKHPDIDCSDLKFLTYSPILIANEQALPPELTPEKVVYQLIQLPEYSYDESLVDDVDPELAQYFTNRNSVGRDVSFECETQSDSEEESIEPRESVSSESVSDDLSGSFGVSRHDSFKPVVIAPPAAEQKQPSCLSMRSLMFFAAATTIGGLAFIHQTHTTRHNPSQKH